MKQKMVIPHAAGDDLFHVLRETSRQSDFSILFFLSLNIMSFVHFLLQVRTIKCDLDSIYEHDSLQQFCTGLLFFLITVCNVVVARQCFYTCL